MKKNIFAITYLFCLLTGLAAFQQQCDYQINAQLDTNRKILTGSESVVYYNNSPDTLFEIFLELYPESFKPESVWWKMEQRSSNPAEAFPFWFSESSLTIIKVEYESIPLEITKQGTYAKIKILQGIPPKSLASFNISFQYKIPRIFERSGYFNSNFHMIRWYPMIAVYDINGWNLDEHIELSEFYGNFGNYKVNLTVPSDFIAVGSGVILSETTNEDVTKTIVYEQENAHNFVFCADKKYEIYCMVYNDIPVAYYSIGKDKNYKKILTYAQDALEFYSKTYGDYPYKFLNIVETESESAMEYPGLVMIDRRYFHPIPLTQRITSELVIVHEIGHIWWYGASGNNEYDEAWLDEGINSYCEQKYFEKKYGKTDNVLAWPDGFPNFSYRLAKEDGVLSYILQGYNQPVIQPANRYSTINSYSMAVYIEAEFLLDFIEELIGEQVFNTVLRNFYSQYKFKHPNTSDFIRILNEVSGKNWTDFFNTRFYNTGITASDVKGRSSTMRTGIRYSFLPDIPDSDEIVFSILPMPWFQMDNSGSNQLSAGALLFAKYRLMTGFTGYLFPNYIFSENRVDLDYFFTSPIYLFKKPVCAQTFTIAGDLTNIEAVLSTSVGPYIDPLYSLNLDLTYMYETKTGTEFKTNTGFTHFKTDYDYFTIDTESTLYPYARLTAGIDTSVVLYWRLSLNLLLESGFPAYNFEDITYNAMPPWDINPFKAYQKLDAGITLPLTGDLYFKLLGNALSFTSMDLSAGVQFLYPGAIKSITAIDSLPAHFIYLKLAFKFKLFDNVQLPQIGPVLIFNSLDNYMPQIGLLFDKSIVALKAIP